MLIILSDHFLALFFFKERELTVYQESKKHTPLQSIDVLRVHPEQLVFVMQQPDEVVRQTGTIIPRIQLFSQDKERFGIVMEIVNLKYCLCVGEVVLLEVVIKATSR